MSEEGPEALALGTAEENTTRKAQANNMNLSGTGIPFRSRNILSSRITRGAVYDNITDATHGLHVDESGDKDQAKEEYQETRIQEKEL